MKKFVYFICILAVIGFIISNIFAAVPTFPITAKAVMQLTAQGNYQQAYALFSNDFQRNVSLDNFQQIMQQNGLNKFREVKWVKNVKSRNEQNGYVVGIVTTTENKKVPVEFDFVHVQGKTWFDQGWRINDFKAGGAAEAGLY